ncbi:hypothetical protein BH10PSE2_BH10PSE2_20150 [soil metagenome]
MRFQLHTPVAAIAVLTLTTGVASKANAAISPADKWTISGAVGHHFVSSNFDDTPWNVGAAYQLTSNLAFDVRYHDTDEQAFGDIYGSRAVASLKATF